MSVSYAQSAWDSISALFNNDEFNINVYGTFLVSFLAYWGFGSFFTFVDLTGRPSFMLKYKIQDNVKSYPISKSQFLDLCKVLIQNQLLTFPLILLSYNMEKTNGRVFEREIPSLITCVFSLFIFLLVREVSFYYSHRLLHHPLIYKFIHKKHHNWISPIAISAAYCHPVEHIVSNVLPIALGPSLLKSHTALLWIWTIYCVLETLTAHSGYHLPFLRSPEFHDFHHLKFNYNYGVLGLLDYLHGTDSLFRKSKEFKRHKRMWTLTPVKTLIP